MSPPDLAARLAAREPPRAPRVMYHKWRDLCFLHWHYDPAIIQSLLPDGLWVDTHDGKAWVGLVPFAMCDVRPRFLPPVGSLSNFLELNLRTYVFDKRGRPGVWFFTLECNQPAAVLAARSLIFLPYRHARMQRLMAGQQTLEFSSQRKGDAVTSRFVYELEEPVTEAQPGTLEFFLIERYLLFSKAPWGLMSARVHHQPYPVCGVKLDAWSTHLLQVHGLPEPKRAPDHVAGSPGVDVSVHMLQP